MLPQKTSALIMIFTLFWLQNILHRVYFYTVYFLVFHSFWCVLLTFRIWEHPRLEVYSITSDNGANMLKAVAILSDMQGDGLSNDGDAMEATLDTEMDEDEPTAEQVENQELTVELDLVVHGHVLRSVRCSAHTIHALKDRRSSIIIAKARCVAKQIHTQNLVAVLKRMGHKRAIVDCATRWHSTHNMLERLFELRSFCEDMSPTIKELHLTESEWEDLSNLVCALKPAKIATKCLQSDQLTAGDFYGAWLKCVLDTDKIDSPFAKQLVQCLKVHCSTMTHS